MTRRIPRIFPLFLAVSLAGLSAAAAQPGSVVDTARLVEADWMRQATRPLGGTTGPMTPALDAAGAVDGLKNGLLGFHTSQDEQPWWQVDLTESKPLDRVIVYNRLDENMGPRAYSICVAISDDGQTWQTVFENDGVPFFGAEQGPPLSVKLDGRPARFVRLFLPQMGFLHLDEVEVYAVGSEENIALRRPALQSSASQWSAPPAPPSGKENAAFSHEVLRAALDLAEKTLAFVEKVRPLPEQSARLKQFAATIDARLAAGSADTGSLYLEVRRLRREIILLHPALDFDRLLINKRPPPGFCHQSDQYLGRYSRPGSGLVVLDQWKAAPRETVLLADQLPAGSVLHPDLSFDAQKILFSYCDHTEPQVDRRRFFIYEINVDGTGLRQVTGTRNDPLEGWDGRQTVMIEDWDPCYLPDGGIAFVSTRNQGGVPAITADGTAPPTRSTAANGTARSFARWFSARRTSGTRA